MSREVEPGDPDEDREPRPAGHVGPTSVGALVTFGLTGLVLGWLVRPVSIRLEGAAPTVGWLPGLALLFVAVVVAAVAWSTHRALHTRRQRIEPHRAVNRLVLAKSCALAGAMVAGGYLGFALSWAGIADADLSRQRIAQSLAAGVAGMLLVAASLALERACRVRGDDPRDLP